MAAIYMSVSWIPSIAKLECYVTHTYTFFDNIYMFQFVNQL